MGVNPLRSALHDRPSRGGRPALRAVVAAALVAAAVGLTGCAPGPAPKPTPTPVFTSEADAFKAAEQVFRRFVDAKNSAQNGEKAKDPQDFLAGAALEDDIQSLRDDEKSGTRIEGTSTVLSFLLKKFDAESRTVESVACLDISKSRLIAVDGTDVTPPNRPPKAALTIKTMPVRNEMRIFQISGSADACR